MKIYLVGGTVRDKLLGLPTKDNDWLVIGETPETMMQQGFRPVGKDFPVFLHPQTQEEYALARMERKTGPGYTGFVCHSTPDVTLEQDLLRRDLTINAMAMTPEGRLIDPYHGQIDLQQRIFRHVSPAFAEDPVRILRLARFAARYRHLGFNVAEETRALMQTMVAAGEVDHLVPERVWAELLKALQEPTPSAFFYTLQDCQALPNIFPELHALFGVPQPEKYHPEIDSGVHSLMSLDQAALLSNKAQVRFAALVHDLGKALTPRQQWPSHHGHEAAGIPVLEKLCHRLRIPNSFKTLAKQVMAYHGHCHKAFQLRPSTLTDLLVHLGACKASNRTLADFVLACTADALGRTGLEHQPYPQADFLICAAKAAAFVNSQTLASRSLQGAAFGEALRQLRIKAVASYIAQNHSATASQ